MNAKFNIGNLAIFIENYLFPFLFGYYAYKSCHFLYRNYDLTTEIIGLLRGGVFYLDYISHLSDIFYNMLLMFFNLLIVWALLIRKNLYQRPEGFLEYFLPLLGTFSYLSYSLLPYLPKKWNLILFPQSSLLYLSVIGSFISIVGLIISCLATYDLRRSFGVFVQVRQIITKGTYRHVRHPIYLGYIFIFTGFLLIMPRVYNLIIALISTLLAILRAIIEERKLAAFSPAYVKYMSTTPMIFPVKFKRIENAIRDENTRDKTSSEQTG